MTTRDDLPGAAAPAPGGRTAGGIAYDDEGAGDAVVLAHAGVADRRMWTALVAALTRGRRVIRFDARGFGESLAPAGAWSQHGDLLGLLDELGVTRAHLVGASMGAGIVTEAALERPGLARSLVLVAPGGALYGEEAPSQLRPIWDAEIAALDDGDLDRAVEVNLAAWVDGPARRPDAVDPAVRAFVGRMQREAFEIPEWDPVEAPEHELAPPASARFAELACPVLVVVGEGDQAATFATAERIAATAPDARLFVWPDVAHMLTLERPDAFAELLLTFLAEVESRPR
jgi:pimeloyl-ACP methyl ester carboxylesterase